MMPNWVKIVFGVVGSAMSIAASDSPALAVQNVRPSGEKPLSWPSSPVGVLDSSRGWRQFDRTS